MYKRQIQDNLSEIKQRRAHIRSMQSNLEQGNLATQEDVQRTQTRVAQLRVQYNAITQDLTELRVKRMGLQKESDAAQNEQKRLEHERARMQQSISTCDRAREQNALTLEELQTKAEALSQRVVQEQKQIELQKECQIALEEERTLLMRKIMELRDQKEDVSRSLRDLEARRQDVYKRQGHFSQWG